VDADSVSNWIAAGALAVSLLVALRQILSDRRQRRAEIMNAEYKRLVYETQVEGRAKLTVRWWGFLDTFTIENLGPKRLQTFRSRSQTGMTRTCKIFRSLHQSSRFLPRKIRI
jgi:hypothetical protein